MDIIHEIWIKQGPMRSFEQILLRLKERLGVQTDKDVARLLGLSPTAFGERKKRGIFPAEKLRAVALDNPAWDLDVDYVLVGTSPRTQLMDQRLGALGAATQRTVPLGLPDEYARLVQGILFGVELQNGQAVRDAIDAFLLLRSVAPVPASPGAKPKTR